MVKEMVHTGWETTLLGEYWVIDLAWSWAWFRRPGSWSNCMERYYWTGKILMQRQTMSYRHQHEEDIRSQVFCPYKTSGSRSC